MCFMSSIYQFYALYDAPVRSEAEETDERVLRLTLQNTYRGHNTDIEAIRHIQMA